MNNIINFLDTMIAEPLKSIDFGSGPKELSSEQRAGFKIACVVVKSMIEQQSEFKVINKDVDNE